MKQRSQPLTPRRQPPTSGALAPSEETLRSKIKKLISIILNILEAPLRPFEFPAVDAALYWALAIVPGCLKWIQRERIDLIYSISFPYSDHVTGYLLRKLTGLPWVADFRDPWTQNAGRRITGWRHRVDQWIEQHVLMTTDRIIGVTPTNTANSH